MRVMRKCVLWGYSQISIFKVLPSTLQLSIVGTVIQVSKYNASNEYVSVKHDTLL